MLRTRSLQEGDPILIYLKHENPNKEMTAVFAEIKEGLLYAWVTPPSIEYTYTYLLAFPIDSISAVALLGEKTETKNVIAVLDTIKEGEPDIEQPQE